MLIPFLAGIALYEWGRGAPVWVGYTGVAVGVFACAVMLLAHWRASFYRRRWVFGAGLLLVFTGVGVLRAFIHERSVYCDWPGQPRLYRAVLLESPVVANNRLRCRARLVSVSDSATTRELRKQVLLYLPSDSAARGLTLCDELLFYGQVNPPANRGNPYEFDYARYLHRQGISGIAHADSGLWKPLKGQAQPGVRQQALLLRERILQRYRSLGIRGDTFAVLAALTIGYKNELDEDMRADYSRAGASHVLALSGLHIGILYVLLLGFFNLLTPASRWVIGKGLLSLLLLWSFAFISGLSASVVRSVTMFSLLIVAQMLRRQRTGLNTISIAAFFMLLWNPCYLFDVSFQLSFSAVAGIMLGVPWLMRKFPVKQKLLSRLWELTLVSVAAQLATLPFILYYFSTFPLYGILFSLPVVFLATLIIWAALAVLLLGMIPVLQPLLTSLLVCLVDMQNTLVSWAQYLPLPVLELPSFRFADAIFLFLLLLLAVVQAMGWVRYKVLGWVTLLLLWGVCGFAAHRRAASCKPHVVFYNTSQPVIHFVADHRMSYLLADTCSLDASSARTVETYSKALRLNRPGWLSAAAVTPYGWTDQGLVCFRGYTVCVVPDNRWQGCTSLVPYPVDCLYLTRGFTGQVSQLIDLFRPGKVVLHRSLGRYRSEAVRKACAELGVECVLLQKDGALLVNI